MSSLPSVEIDYEMLAKKARQHIEVLAEHIGARPAGSIQEQQACDYLAGVLNQLGYEIELQPIAFAPYSPLSLPFLLTALVLGASGWLIPIMPWLVIWLPLWMMILPQASRIWVQQRKPSKASANLFAYRPNKVNAIPKIILSAHIDSAAALPFRNPLILKGYSQAMDIIQRIAWMVAALALLQWIGFSAGNAFVIAVAILASLAGFGLLVTQLLTISQYQKSKTGNLSASYSPGANDNASGVGVLLALAEAFAQGEVAEQVALLFTSAEESGLYGARAFCANHENWRHNTFVICLDMVGRGEDLYYVQREGIFKPLYTDQTINQMLLQANPHLKGVWYTLRSGDFAAFCRAGFPTTSLQSGRRGLVDWRYHSVYDTADQIETPALQTVLETIGKLVINY